MGVFMIKIIVTVLSFGLAVTALVLSVRLGYLLNNSYDLCEKTVYN